MPFDFLSNLFKGKKTEPQAAAPAPAAEPPKPASLGDITGGQIDEMFKTLDLPSRSLDDVLIDMSNRLITRGTEPHLNIGWQLQNLRESLDLYASPFMDFDTALISAVEQLEHYCDYGGTAACDTAMKMLHEIFAGRANSNPTVRREVFQLKGHYLNAQLLSMQGQLFQSQATIRNYKAQLAKYEANKALDPTGMQASQIKLVLEHSEKMQNLLINNIGTLKNSIISNKAAIEDAPLVSIDPKAALQSTVEMINEQRQVYLAYLRQLSDANLTLKMISEGATEIAVQERVTMQTLRETQMQIEMEQTLRQKRAAYEAYMPGKNPVVAAQPVEIPAVPNVVEIEENKQEPAPINFLDF